MIKSFWEVIRKEKIRNNKGKMSTWRIYMSGSIKVHKCSRHHYMPEYGSKWRILHIYVCVCICEECKRCLLIVLSVMKIIEVNFIVPWIFYSFNDVFVSSYSFKMFWDLIGLLSNYHNRSHQQLNCLWWLAPSLHHLLMTRKEVLLRQGPLRPCTLMVTFSWGTLITQLLTTYTNKVAREWDSL